ncbi:thermonuclease family protein [Salinarimonas ramus]|uniref:TNase-like domain-containing protein n=1 Tax=Salinarimonas ramus TaxID=690164 RepID=A0A917Q6F0_9HYPH|nr:thermonuclease family protein [Salinarimonas ramus]GGK28423.1 hypothetical protein GCM10011322_13620 [Salinarimonas ramus]
MAKLPSEWKVYQRKRGLNGLASRVWAAGRASGRSVLPFAVVGVLIGVGAVSFIDLISAKSPPFSPSLWFCEDRTHLGLVGKAAVIDGDTIRLCGLDTSVRLYGIDAPESGQPCRNAAGRSYRCGSEATATLSDLIGRTGRVSCERKDVDRYGRIVAVCRAGGLDINAEMVRQGWAVEYRRYSDGRYRDEEAAARDERRGLWAGSFVAPWDHRRGEVNVYR